MKFISNRIIILYIILVFLLGACLSGMSLSFSYEKYAEYELNSFKKELVDTQYLRLTDIYGLRNNPGFYAMLKEEDSLERLKGMNRDLNNSFHYFEVYRQSVEFMSFYKGDQKFAQGYEAGNSDLFVNQLLNIEEGPVYCTPLNATQIGKQAYQFYNVDAKIQSGRPFSLEEFNAENDFKTMPVLLGYEYLEQHKLGDKININYLGMDIALEVVGFLKDGAYISEGNNILLLNREIVMPFLDFKDIPLTEDEKYLQQVQYALRNSCFIAFDESEQVGKIQKTFDDICKKNDLLFQTIDQNDMTKDLSQSELSSMKAVKEIIFTFTLIIYGILSLVVIILIMKNIEQQKKWYVIHLMSGASLSEIKRSVFFKIILIFTCGLIVGSTGILAVMNKLSINFHNMLPFFPKIIIIYLIFMILVVLLANYYIHKCDFKQGLKEKI